MPAAISLDGEVPYFAENFLGSLANSAKPTSTSRIGASRIHLILQRLIQFVKYFYVSLTFKKAASHPILMLTTETSQEWKLIFFSCVCVYKHL